jgi:hypothetical protein
MIRRCEINLLLVALVLWSGTAVAVSVRTLLRPTSHTVFPVFANGPQRWWSDQPLYSLTFGHDREGEEPDHFRYPPAFAIAFTPFDQLGPRLGGVLWGWLCLGVYGLGLWRYARDVLPGPWSPNRLGWFLILALLGALRGLWNGQSNALAAGCLLLAGSFLVRQCWWRTATFLTGAITLKLTPIAPALLLVALWPRRLAARLAIVVALVGLLPFLTRPPETVLAQYRLWATHLSQSGRERWPGFRDAYTVYQAARETLRGVDRPFPYKEPLDSSFYRVVQVLAAGAALAWCLRQQRMYPGEAGDPWQVNLALALGCGWLMLFGPAVEHAGFAFLAPFQAWALSDGVAWRRGGRALLIGSGVCVLVLGWGSLTRPLTDAIPLFLCALPVGTALFLIWLVRHTSQGPLPQEELLSSPANPDNQRLSA